MRKIFLILIFSVLVLSSCARQLPGEKVETTVTKSGNLTMKSGEIYLLKTDDGIINITSSKVNLDDYIKKNISVTGQFSGSTLYVDEVR